MGWSGVVRGRRVAAFARCAGDSRGPACPRLAHGGRRREQAQRRTGTTRSTVMITRRGVDRTGRPGRAGAPDRVSERARRQRPPTAADRGRAQSGVVPSVRRGGRGCRAHAGSVGDEGDDSYRAAAAGTAEREHSQRRSSSSSGVRSRRSRAPRSGGAGQALLSRVGQGRQSHP